MYINLRKLVIIILFVLLIPTFGKENNKKINWIELAKKTGGFYGISDIDVFPEDLIEPSNIQNYLKGKKLYAPTINRLKPKGIKKVNYKISSSSYLREDKLRYLPIKAHDNNLMTAWVEGIKGFGFKEWIKFNYIFKLDPKIDYGGTCPTYVIIYPGLSGRKGLFKKNNRLKTLILIAVSNKKGRIKEGVLSLKYNKTVTALRLYFDDEEKYHSFVFDDPLIIGNNLEFTFYIESVYFGSKYNDTCISEIIFAMHM